MYTYIIRDKDTQNYDPLMTVIAKEDIKDELQECIETTWQFEDYNTDMLQACIFVKCGDKIVSINDVPQGTELYF